MYLTRRKKPKPIGVHDCDRWEALKRYELRIQQLFSSGAPDLQEHCQKALQRIADTRNLRVAWDYLATHGGEAVGPDGRRYDDFAEFEIWELLSELSKRLLDGSYRCGPERVAQVPKTSGAGCRPIVLQNVADRAVQRAVKQILEPLVDPTFSANSFGGRPHRSPWRTMAYAQATAVNQRRFRWTVADVQDCFANVPHAPLLQLVEKQLGHPPLSNLLAQLIANDKGRGLRQGSALSPLLVNLYLDRCLDQPWRRAHPGIPLLRYIDDLLILGSNDDPLANLQGHLRTILLAAGMPLKDAKTCIGVDLAAGGAVPWLGFTVSYQAGALQFGMDEPAIQDWLEKCGQELLELHWSCGASRRAWELIEGKLTYLGPAYRHVQRDRFYAGLQDVASEAGFEEIPTTAALDRIWQQSHEKWLDLRQQ